MSSSKIAGIKFVNVELKFKPELYLGKGEEFPNEAQMFDWISSLAANFYRVGFGYNERSSSFTASATYKGGKTTDDAPCLTQHGRTPLSALYKLWLILELAGGKTEGYKFASDVLLQLEDRIEIALEKLLD